MLRTIGPHGIWLMLAVTGVLAGCRIEVAVPVGGAVHTESGAYNCPANTTCTIEVVDQHFDETFHAVPQGINSFLGWARGDGALCPGSQKPCRLTTAGFADDPALRAILESDDVFTLTPEFLVNERIARDNLQANGAPLPAEDSVRVQGSLALGPDDSEAQAFTGADLQLGFNEQGELLTLAGGGTLPREITDHVGILSTARSEIGLYTGAQINAIEDIGIRLINERDYLLFYLFSGVELEVGDRRGGSAVVNLQPPLGATVVMILDPEDQMLYRFGSALGETRGQAESDQGLLPYVPLDGLGGAPAFYGHTYETAEKSIGIKVFDILNFSGEFIVREPSFSDVDLADPFDSPVGYFAGFNGSAQVAFAILGVGLFEFDLAQASANFDVQPLKSLDQQRLRFFARIAPDVSWQPDWFPFLPETQLQAQFNANAAGKLRVKIGGKWRSRLPRAALDGKLDADNDGVTLYAKVSDAGVDFPVSLELRDGVTTARVDLDAAIGDFVRSEMDDAFADVERQIDEARTALDEALADYEFELSLRGLREALPDITGTAIGKLQAVPGQAYSTVKSRVRSEIKARQKCVLVCVPSNATIESKAESAGKSARSQASSAVAPYISALAELRDRAAQADNDTVREALRQALYEVYDRRRINYTVTVTVRVDVPGSTITVTERYPIDRDVVTPSQASDILLAAENIDRIPETSQAKLDAQAVLDRLPLDEALATAKREVEDGLKVLPGLAAVGYRVSGEDYTGLISFRNGREYSVDFNVLDQQALAAGVNVFAVKSIID